MSRASSVRRRNRLYYLIVVAIACALIVTIFIGITLAIQPLLDLFAPQPERYGIR